MRPRSKTLPTRHPPRAKPPRSDLPVFALARTLRRAYLGVATAGADITHDSDIVMVLRLRSVCAFLCTALMLATLVGCQNGDRGQPMSADNVRPGITQARKALKNNWKDLLLDQEHQHLNSKPIAQFFALKTPPIGLVHKAALEKFYRANGWLPIFIDENGAPNFRAHAVFDEAKDADRHALAPQKYLRPAIATLIAQQRELNHAWHMSPLPTLSKSDWQTLEHILDEEDIKAAKKPLPKIFDRILSENSPLPNLQRAWEDRILLQRALLGTNALLELAIADAWLDWAYDMSDGYWTKVNDQAKPETQEEIRLGALFASMSSIKEASSYAEAQKFITSKIPHYEQYGRLLKARERYKKIVANGGWEEVPSNRNVRRGSRGDHVAALKRRLHAEGYFEGTLDDRFDGALETAFKKYQETHQFKDDGVSSANFWSSLNVSAEERLEQIELTLQRWRESRIGDDDYYVLINIPDFHAEVWRDGVREMRFRIVVGNTQRECRNNRMTYVNATPIQSGEIDHVILNPYWTVPQRITEEEILPAYMKDPTYLERNNYEKITASNGYTMIRQLPGPTNALGKVKFMFPNNEHTYLHDTPRKVYFDAPTRAFSHGCMRVQNPLDFLEYLLTNDNNWDKASIDKIFERGREYRINLKKPVPIHSEYYVVRVDDDGYVHFMADLYRYDRERLDLHFEREPSCERARDNRGRLRLDSEGTLRRLNEAGEWVDAREEELLQELPFIDQEQIERQGDSGTELPAAPPGLPIDMGP